MTDGQTDPCLSVSLSVKLRTTYAINLQTLCGGSNTERKENKEQLESLIPPDFIIDDVPRFPDTVRQISGKALTGLGVAAGKATGIAKLVTHPKEGTKLEVGNILVAPSTDPGWTPLFLKVSGIVMETGGFLSHGAIVAREYGIPSVVNIPGVMSIISDGNLITVDGDNGQIILDH